MSFEKGDGGVGWIERLALAGTRLAERWMPDAFVFALAFTLVVVLGAFAVDEGVRADPMRVVVAWGDGFWVLIPFTLQMSMIILGGYVLARAPPVRRLIHWLAAVPQSSKGAVTFVALVSMLSSLLNWGFSLIFTAMLAREVARRRPDADYRALGASALLGLGTVWAQGLSGSAALQMASASSIPKALQEVVGTPIPLTETIFRLNSLIAVGVELVVVCAVVWFAAPGPGRARSAAELGVDLKDPPEPADDGPPTPGEWLERSPLLLQPIVLLGLVYLGRQLVVKGGSVTGALAAIDFNFINLLFLLLAALLHGTPRSLMRAFAAGTPTVWGVLLQFPFYAGIFGVMTGTALSHTLAGWFVGLSNPTFYPAMIVIYSAVLGVFVPSGGSKWVIEAPYVLGAARELGVPDGWMVVTYDLGEAVANLVQPFWMLPTLALLGLKARDVMGFTWVVAVVLLPLVLVLVTVLAP